MSYKNKKTFSAQKNYYQRNKEKILSSKKIYYQRNKEKISSVKRIYESNNREKIAFNNKIYYLENKKEILSNNKERYSEKKEAINAYTKTYRKTIKGRFGSYKHSAKQRGHIFDLTIEDFEKIILGKCFYCGEDGYGIDRMDNNIGYILTNSVSCCYQCNMMKMDYTIEEFLDKCDKISNLQKIKKGII